jgi:hypothetical protein
MHTFQEFIANSNLICWYPSAGTDLAPAYFINTFSAEEEADLFIFTDFIYREYPPKHSENYRDNNLSTILLDSLNVNEIRVDAIHPLGYYDFGQEIAEDGINERVPSPLYYGEFTVTSKVGDVDKQLKVLFIGCHNEAFCNNFLFANRIHIRYLIFKRPQTMNMLMTNLWIYNTIKPLGVKFVATDIEGQTWNEYDGRVIELYPDLGPETTAAVFSPEEQAVMLTLNNQPIAFPTVSVKRLFNGEVYNKRTFSNGFGINKVPDIL